MDVRGELKPGRDFIIALGLSAIAAAAIFSAPGPAFPVLHTILNTGIALGTVAVSLLFWDLGWRTRAPLIRFLAIVFVVVGVLEIQHVLAALEPASASETLNDLLWRLRSGTWAPPAYLLPLGMGAASLIAPSPRASKTLFAAGRSAARLACSRCSSGCRATRRPAGWASSARRWSWCRCCGSRWA